MMKTILYYLALTLFIPTMLFSEESGNKTAVENENSQSSAAEREDDLPDVIVLKPREVRNFEMIEVAQQKHINKLHPNYRALFSIYTKDKQDRFIEAVSCINDEEERILVYFDMSQVYKKLKEKDQETREKIEELEQSYISLK